MGRIKSYVFNLFFRRRLTVPYLPEFLSLSIPQAPIQVSSLGTKRWVGDFEAIIDTAAEITCLPEHVIKSIADLATFYNFIDVQWPSGKTTKQKTYLIHLKLDRCEVRNLEVIALEADVAIIGRDVLNKHKITLDGPNEISLIKLSC